MCAKIIALSWGKHILFWRCFTILLSQKFAETFLTCCSQYQRREHRTEVPASGLFVFKRAKSRRHTVHAFTVKVLLFFFLLRILKVSPAPHRLVSRCVSSLTSDPIASPEFAYKLLSHRNLLKLQLPPEFLELYLKGSLSNDLMRYPARCLRGHITGM